MINLIKKCLSKKESPKDIKKCHEKEKQYNYYLENRFREITKINQIRTEWTKYRLAMRIKHDPLVDRYHQIVKGEVDVEKSRYKILNHLDVLKMLRRMESESEHRLEFREIYNKYFTRG